MPQITFELTDNIIETELDNILLEVHHILTDTLPTPLDNCKSKILRHQKFLVGNGDSNNAFIQLSIECMSGRSQETLDLTAKKILKILQNNFKESHKKLNLQVGVTIKELPAIYHKYKNH